MIDEVQRLPELFPVLRVLIDRPDSPAKFLLLGSAEADSRATNGRKRSDDSGLEPPRSGASKRHVVVGGFGERVVGVEAPGPAGRRVVPAGEPPEGGRFRAQEKLHLAGGVSLPAAAAEPVAHLDLIAQAEIVYRIAAILDELERDEVGEGALFLLEHDQPLPEALLSEGLDLFDQVDDASDARITHVSASDPVVLSGGATASSRSAPKTDRACHPTVMMPRGQ